MTTITENGPVVLTDEQAKSLKHQPDTDQGLRDQALMCLILNEKLAVKTVCSLRATSLDLITKGLLLSEKEELPLTMETLQTLRRYVTRTMPSVFLMQASLSNGTLDGGGITPAAVYVRVEHLGRVLGLPGKLTVEACYAYHDPQLTVPQKRLRTLSRAMKEKPPQDDTPLTFALPGASIDMLMTGLANLEEWLGTLQGIQQGGNITPHIEHLCRQIDAQCATLSAELAGLRRVVKVLPLHFLLLRLFPHLDEEVTESLLLKLEVSAITALTNAFTAGTPRHEAEERAYRECALVVRREFGDEKLEALKDLLKGIAIYAGMHTQRGMESDLWGW